MDTEEQKDGALLEDLKKGDEKSFREIYNRYHQQLYGVALKYLRSKKLAEDAVHDVFLKLWNNRRRLDRSGSLKGFLFTATKNHVLNLIKHDKRKLKKHVQLSYEKKIDQIEADNVIALSEYRALYQTAVEQLPEKRRQVFELRTNDGLTNKEAAEYLELSVHTIKSQYYKATKFIKKFVGDRINTQTGT